MNIAISLREDIFGGKPIIKGTRISVSHIAGYYLLGLSPKKLKELPSLRLAQIFDALAFILIIEKRWIEI